MQQNWLIYTIVGAIGFALLLSVSRRREYCAYKFKLILSVEIAYAAGVFISAYLGRRELEPILWGALAAFVVFIRTKPRSRHIPASVKRRRVAEYELRTGKKYNPRRDELDHDVPFARGGSHTEDNLRVVEKRKNRKKGSKSPWWDLLSR